MVPFPPQKSLWNQERAGKVVGGEKKTRVGQWERRLEEDKFPPFSLFIAPYEQQSWPGGMNWFPYKSF